MCFLLNLVCARLLKITFVHEVSMHACVCVCVCVCVVCMCACVCMRVCVCPPQGY